MCTCRAKREFLESKLRDVEGQLQESKADRAASGRERKMSEALAHMQRTIPGAIAPSPPSPPPPGELPLCACQPPETHAKKRKLCT